jgi:hypothetical protein
MLAVFSANEKIVNMLAFFVIPILNPEGTSEIQKNPHWLV